MSNDIVINTVDSVYRVQVKYYEEFCGAKGYHTIYEEHYISLESALKDINRIVEEFKTGKFKYESFYIPGSNIVEEFDVKRRDGSTYKVHYSEFEGEYKDGESEINNVWSKTYCLKDEVMLYHSKPYHDAEYIKICTTPEIITFKE